MRDPEFNCGPHFVALAFLKEAGKSRIKMKIAIRKRMRSRSKSRTLRVESRWSASYS